MKKIPEKSIADLRAIPTNAGQEMKKAQGRALGGFCEIAAPSSLALRLAT